jgi:hypothetical protein
VKQSAPLNLNMLAKRVIRPALRNRKNYRDGESQRCSANRKISSCFSRWFSKPTH